MTKRKEKRVPKKSRLRVVLPPTLIVAGIGVTVIASIILWRQDPTASPRTIISRVIDRPYILGATACLTLGGIAVAFFLSSKETQRRSLKAMLTILAAFLVFGGPTYMMYALQQLVVPYSLLVLIGIVSFIVGLLLFTRLMKGRE